MADMITGEMEERLVNGSSSEEEIGDLKRRVWIESKKLWRVAFPAMLSRATQFGMFVITQAFIGHLGELDLAAYALIQIIAIRFANGIVLGMSSATETLCGQAFGAKQYHMLGIYLQRSWIINLATASIILFAFIFATPIFKLLREQTDIADEAGYIALWFIPMLYFFALSMTTQMFLQAQLKNMIVGWLSLAGFVIHIVLSWVFVLKLNWGIPGAMSAMGIGSWFISIGMFVYMFGGWCPHTWTGFSTAAFVDLFPVLKLSVSSGVMFCVELWYTSILVLLAGYMKNATVEISAFSICLNITAWEFMIVFGFFAASCVRVANELGRGNAKAAKFAVKVAICTTTAFGIFFTIICLIFSRQIALLFTSDTEVVEYVSSLTILFAISILLNGFQAVLSGVAVGAGRQGIVAYVNIVCYYIIGIPIGVVLGYVADLKVAGIWIGMVLGVVMQVIVLCYITYTTNWDQQVNMASERLNRWLLKSDEPDDNA